jgi:hypothetical protein
MVFKRSGLEPHFQFNPTTWSREIDQKVSDLAVCFGWAYFDTVWLISQAHELVSNYRLMR